jgi:Semialdehyde dehydrogenase, NAD binding domain
MPKLTALSMTLVAVTASAFAPAASFSNTKALSAASLSASTQPREVQVRHGAVVHRRAARLAMATAQAEATKGSLTADGHIIRVVGATGAVGEEIVSVLHRRSFPVKELKLFSSARSAGKVTACTVFDTVFAASYPALFKVLMFCCLCI